MKRKFRDNVWEYTLEDSMSGESDSSHVFHAAYNAMDQAFQKKVIVAAFRDRGIWPWRRDVVMKNALEWTKALGTTHSAEERGQFISNVVDAAVEQSQARSSARKESRTRAGVKARRGKPVTRTAAQTKDPLPRKRKRSEDKERNVKRRRKK